MVYRLLATKVLTKVLAQPNAASHTKNIANVTSGMKQWRKWHKCPSRIVQMPQMYEQTNGRNVANVICTGFEIEKTTEQCGL